MKKVVGKLNSFDLILIAVSLLLITFSVKELINPKERFAHQNNQQRLTDLNQIADALYKYKQDTGELPTIITNETQLIKDTVDANICQQLVPKYLQKIPYEPHGGHYGKCEIYESGYYIKKNEDGTITLAAPSAELGVKIEVTK